MSSISRKKLIIVSKIETLKAYLEKKSEHIILPGKSRITLFEISSFLITSIGKGKISTRASSIAFKMFLAVFPAIIFLFTLIPYIPIDNFQDQLLELFKSFMPHEAYLTVRDTIIDIAIHKRGGLLSMGFVFALYFATNGINAIITAFNETSLALETRTWIQKRIISIFLVAILTILVTVAIAIITSSGFFFDYLVKEGILRINVTYYLLIAAKWFIVIALSYFAISFIYYLAPAKKTDWRFFSLGSSIATVLTIIVSLGFSIFVNNFGQYNKLYGSIGTLIVVLIWIYLNAFILLIGFEVNASIKNVHIKRNLKKLENI